MLCCPTITQRARPMDDLIFYTFADQSLFFYLHYPIHSGLGKEEGGAGNTGVDQRDQVTSLDNDMRARE